MIGPNSDPHAYQNLEAAQEQDYQAEEQAWYDARFPDRGSADDESMPAFMLANSLDGIGDLAPWLRQPILPKICPKPGLGNPFRGMSPQEFDAMFKKRGFQPRGPDPLNGKGGYVNPETGRSYHIDDANSFGESPHVDVNRPKGYNGPLDKKKYQY